MSDGDRPRRLKLRHAVVEWCDPYLIKAIRAEEAKTNVENMARTKWPYLSWTAFPMSVFDAQEEMNFVILDSLWQLVTDEFAWLMEGGSFYLSGVMLAPDLSTVQQSIPGVWASACKFDFKSSVVTVNGMRFGSVTASRTAPAATGLSGQEAAGGERRPMITAEVVPSLTDDEVFALLEDYARRVVEDPESRLKMPVKVSFMPIIRRKMEHRFQTGETRETLGAEAWVLAEWIKTKAPSHQTPSTSTIEKQLGSHYRRPKPTSKGEIR